MQVYYNEWDKPTSTWLGELGRSGNLTSGHIDTRSICDVSASDLQGYDQCHFFAGIGGWSLALRLAGYGDLPCWTGSPPCQPFSVAGQQRGKDDDRHLAPVWLNLVRKCRPPILFGEQVADAIRHGWLDDLFDALEECGYACGAAVLPACSIGAPHLRKRLFFGAVRLADPKEQRPPYGRKRSVQPLFSKSGGECSRMAHSDNTRPQRRPGMPECADEQPIGPGSLESGSASSHNGFWSGADWLGCRDGKFRPVEPGTQPLAHGLPARVGRLRGYGNAIVSQVAATFITEFMGAVYDLKDGEKI